MIREYLKTDPAGRTVKCVIEDLYDRIGPMGGLLSVFESTGAECFVLLAVDIPDADMQVLSALADISGQCAEAAVMLRITGSGYAEACAAVYTRKACNLMKASYERGEYSLRKALRKEMIRYIGMEELRQQLPGITREHLLQAFRNINTPSDLAINRPEKETENRPLSPPEILAPAGTVEAMKAAVNAGCDAVYLGGTLFGARAYAGNFDEPALLQTLDFCHLFGVKVYMTVNTLLKEAEISQLKHYMEPYYLAGLDGVIVQDTGVIRVLRETFPGLPVHGSTQMSISSVYGAQLLKDMGLKRVVPARELTLEEILAIRRNVDIEIETFVHGAMCYAYSGKCLFSSFLGGRSGNRGRCAQPCRQCYEMTYDAAHSVREYSMSMKDMCTLSVLPRLIDAGIDSFKIEGRMKNPSYVAATVHAYKTARDCYLEMQRRQKTAWEDLPDARRKEYLSLAERLTADMQDVYNRGGFCEGYYFPDEAGAFRGEKSLSMISRTRPNHSGSRIGEIVRVKGSQVCIRLFRDVNVRDVLEILPAGVELTSPEKGRKGETIWLKARDLSRIKSGMEVWRTRNNELLERIDRDILQQEKKLPVKARIIARIGEPLTIVLASRVKTSVTGDVVQRAQGRPVSAAQLMEKMQKTGGTNLEFLSVECDMDEDAFIPMSRFNDLRREAILQFKEVIYRQYRRDDNGMVRLSSSGTRDGDVTERMTKEAPFCHLDYYVRVRTAKQLEEVLRWGGASVLMLDGELAAEPASFSSVLSKVKEETQIVLCLPDVLRQSRLAMIESQIRSMQKALTCPRNDDQRPASGLLIRSLDELGLIRKSWSGLSGGFPFRLIADPFLYAYNSEALLSYLDLFPDMWLTGSDELTDREQEQVFMRIEERGEKGFPKERVIMKVYGHQPLMISNQCLNRNYKDCRERLTSFTDHRNEQFFAMSNCRQCYSTIYNGKCTWLLDKVTGAGYNGYQNLLLDFTIESEEQVQRILSLIDQTGNEGTRRTGSLESFTRGHHYKGVE